LSKLKERSDDGKKTTYTPGSGSEFGGSERYELSETMDGWKRPYSNGFQYIE
jgi:hypothetical protein